MRELPVVRIRFEDPNRLCKFTLFHENTKHTKPLYTLGDAPGFVEVETEIDIVVGHGSHHDYDIVMGPLHGAVGVDEIHPLLAFY